MKALKYPAVLNSLVILLYIGLAIGFTWPLVLNMSGYTAGSAVEDRDQNLWYLWWINQALGHYHANPYFTPFLYHPGGTSLYLFPANLISGILSMPLQSWFGLVPAFNLLYFLGLVMGAFGAFCLVYYLVQRRSAAILAGLIYAFAPWQYPATLLNQLNIIQLQWLPFFVLWLIKFLNSLAPAEPLINLLRADKNQLSFQRGPKYQVRYGALTALFLILTAYTDQYHLLFSVFLAVALTGLAFIKLGFQRQWRSLAGLVLKLGLIGLIFVIAYFPVLVGTVRDTTSGSYQDTKNEVIEGVDLPGLIFPWVFQRDQKFLQIKLFAAPALSVGWWLILLVALVGIIKFRPARWWGGLLGLILLLSLGSTLTFNSTNTGIPMLTRLFKYIPVISSMHYAWRWLIPGALALAICSAYGWLWFERKLEAGKVLLPKILIRSSNSWPKFVVLIVLATLFFLDAQPQPTSWAERQVPSVPKVFSQDVLTRPGALLELPYNERNFDRADNMRFQIVHQRPIESGYLARMPLFDYGTSPFSFFFEEYPVAAKDMLKVTPAELRSMLSYYNFSYLVLYKSDLDASRLQKFRQMVEQVTGQKTGCLYEDEQTLTCTIEPPEHLQPLLTLSKGWYGAEGDNGGQRWLYGQEGFLGLFVPTNGTYKLNFEGAAYLKSRHLQVEIDGKPAANALIDPARQQYALSLDLTAGNHVMRLYSSEAPDRPSNNGTPGDSRTLTLLFSKLNLSA